MRSCAAFCSRCDGWDCFWWILVLCARKYGSSGTDGGHILNGTSDKAQPAPDAGGSAGDQSSKQPETTQRPTSRTVWREDAPPPQILPAYQTMLDLDFGEKPIPEVPAAFTENVYMSVPPLPYIDPETDDDDREVPFAAVQRMMEFVYHSPPPQDVPPSLIKAHPANISHIDIEGWWAQEQSAAVLPLREQEQKHAREYKLRIKRSTAAWKDIWLQVLKSAPGYEAMINDAKQKESSLIEAATLAPLGSRFFWLYEIWSDMAGAALEVFPEAANNPEGQTSGSLAKYHCALAMAKEKAPVVSSRNLSLDYVLSHRTPLYVRPAWQESTPAAAAVAAASAAPALAVAVQTQGASSALVSVPAAKPTAASTVTANVSTAAAEQSSSKDCPVLDAQAPAGSAAAGQVVAAQTGVATGASPKSDGTVPRPVNPLPEPKTCSRDWIETWPAVWGGDRFGARAWNDDIPLAFQEFETYLLYTKHTPQQLLKEMRRIYRRTLNRQQIHQDQLRINNALRKTALVLGVDPDDKSINFWEKFKQELLKLRK